MGQKLSVKKMEEAHKSDLELTCENSTVFHSTESNPLSQVSSNDDPLSTSGRHFEHLYNSSDSKSTNENANQPSTSTSASCLSNVQSSSLYGTNIENCSVNTPTENHKSKIRKSKKNQKSKETSSRKKRPHWVLRFNCARLKSGGSSSGGSSEPEIAEPNVSIPSCVCTGYIRTEEHHLGAGVVFRASLPRSRSSCAVSTDSNDDSKQLIDLTERIRNDEFAIEDCDERARLERAREIAEGMEPPPGFRPGLVCPQDVLILDSLTRLSNWLSNQEAVNVIPHLESNATVHTQVDYIHCLVPDLLQITTCSFYWGKIDRYEAERLLDGKPEGTFLLRDSAQEEYLFSVSFRKYGRSLHARIEQWKHMFSFDAHDPGVFSSPTVCGLIEHYKDSSCCMFFEPMLTIPLHRNFSFSLQHLSRAVICSKISYDGISQLRLPKSLKSYLKEYHYKQRVKVRVFDSE